MMPRLTSTCACTCDMHMDMHMHMHMHMCMHMHIHVCMCMCMYVHVRTSLWGACATQITIFEFVTEQRMRRVIGPHPVTFRCHCL
jgi:hypothetical protein